MLDKNYFNKEIEEINRYVEGVNFLNKGISNDFISLLEDKLRLQLPLEYKLFMNIYNGGELFRPGTVLSQIYKDESEKVRGWYYLNDIYDKGKKIPNMPDNLIFFATMNYGDKICIDLDKSSEFAYIVQWDIQEEEITRDWKTLKDWLDTILEIGHMAYDYDGSEMD